MPAVDALDHPAGADARVMATARDVMTANPDRVAHTDTLHEVARRMRTLLVAFLPVCDEHSDLCGIIAYRHIGWPCDVQGGDPATVTAASLAEEPPVTIGVDDPVDHLWQVMAEQRVWLLPVLDGRRLVGVIHYADIAATSGSAAPRSGRRHLRPPPKRAGPGLGHGHRGGDRGRPDAGPHRRGHPGRRRHPPRDGCPPTRRRHHRPDLVGQPHARRPGRSPFTATAGVRHRAPAVPTGRVVLTDGAALIVTPERRRARAVHHLRFDPGGGGSVRPPPLGGSGHRAGRPARGSSSWGCVVRRAGAVVVVVPGGCQRVHGRRAGRFRRRWGRRVPRVRCAAARLPVPTDGERWVKSSPPGHYRQRRRVTVRGCLGGAVEGRGSGGCGTAGGPRGGATADAGG